MIKCVKLITGEDLIGDVIEHDLDVVKLKNPLTIVLMPSDQTHFSVGLAPYLPFSNQKEFTFLGKHILLMFDPVAEMKNDYNRITGGLVIAPPPSLSLMK
jgi:F0F1-type ATP synthase alpha subunit